MDDQDTQVTEPPRPERAADVATTEGREDNRNEEAEGSPAPDPTEPAGDEVPEAD